MKARSSKHGDVVLEFGERDEQLLTAAAAAPFRIKRILVPLDFSECSQKALQYALALAQQHSATLTLLYVVTPPPFVSGEIGAIEYNAIETEMHSTGQTKLAQIVTRIGGKVTADSVVRAGAPAREIIDLAKSLPADLVVISTHGRTGLKHVLLGSVAEHVVRSAPCPVLVVRQREHEFITD